MCGATIPEPLREALEWRSHDPEAVLQLGVSYATLQCAELLARGAPGIHFYTLNRSPRHARDPVGAEAPPALGGARRRQDRDAGARSRLTSDHTSASARPRGARQ